MVGEQFAPNATNFHLLKLLELLSCAEELGYGVESSQEAVIAFENKNSLGLRILLNFPKNCLLSILPESPNSWPSSLP